MHFETKAIRIQTEKSQHQEHSTPLFPTSSFTFSNAQEMADGFAGLNEKNIYSRFTNPNCREFEQKMASLEGTEGAFATASGMAAVFATLLTFLEAGDHVLASRALFGSSFQILSDTLPRYGIEYTFLDPVDYNQWDTEVRPNTKLLFIETPTNPGLEIIDLQKAGAFASAYKLLFVVDNCFATPYLQQPLQYGADIIVHSATKYIDGQGRILGGIVCSNDDQIDKVRTFCRRTGPALSPFNAWILSKSLETLAVRMDRHCSNALTLAEHFSHHPKLNWVKYPFLKSHKAHDVARRQMKAGGGIVCFELADGLSGGASFLDKLKMLSLTANLGDTRSIASHPASTTHAKLSREMRLKVGITDGLIRISVGLEHIDDIIRDIEQAL